MTFHLIKPYYLTILGLFMLVSAGNVKAQKTIVFGTVYDAGTLEPIPYANISFQHSSIGAITDYKGYFYIETNNATDTLLASYLGYQMDTVPIKLHQTQEVEFQLASKAMAIEEVIVTPGENPAFKYLNKIYSRKKYNNPIRFETYQYKAYNKLRLDLNNIDEDFTRRKIWKQFQFVFDNMDSSDIFGKNYLPVLITESVSNFYYQKKPKVEKEVIEAYKMSGIENSTFAQFTGKMYQKLNIYDDFITFLEPGFVSPIADFGKLYYKYYIEDSATFDDSWCYKITFKPKRKRERTFYGYFWVADTSWAIKKMQLRVASDVNINFVNDMLAVTDFQKVNDSLWFIKEEEILIDFNLGDESYGFFGRRNAAYTNVVLDEPVPGYIAGLNTDTHLLEDSIKRSDTYWEENRLLELNNDEANVYQMVDSVKKVPVFRTVYSIAEMLFAYYYEVGKFEIGPYYTFYSNNPIEGQRFKVGARTSKQFSTTYRVGGYTAYGTHDKKLKYGLSLEYLFDKNPRQMLSFFYDHDTRLLGKSDNALLDDNILGTILRRSPNYKLTPIDQYSFTYDREWYQGFYNSLKVKYLKVYPTQYVPFTAYTPEGLEKNLNEIISSEVTLHTHYAYKEKYLLGKFDRVSLGTKSPIFDLYLTYGPKGVLNSGYEYFKVKARLRDNIEINPIGYTHYEAYAGKIFGKLPYPLLELHKGNETYAGDRTAFNMMNYYEFVSDEYVSLMAEHHFQGFFLKRIPLLNKLEFREVVGMKFLAGHITQDHESIMAFPNGLNKLSKPYSEASVGIENIFKLFRIDATWRLSYLDNPNIQVFGIRAYLHLMF